MRKTKRAQGNFILSFLLINLKTFRAPTAKKEAHRPTDPYLISESVSTFSSALNLSQFGGFWLNMHAVCEEDDLLVCDCST